MYVPSVISMPPHGTVVLAGHLLVFVLLDGNICHVIVQPGRSWCEWLELLFVHASRVGARSTCTWATCAVQDAPCLLLEPAVAQEVF